jgi:hypothetical protein
VTLVQLGYRGPAPRCADDLRNGVYLLPDTGVVVAVESRLSATRWRCGIIAARSGNQHGHLALTTADLTRADISLTVDPVTDPETFALLWQAHIYRRWLAGHLPILGRVLTESIRPPGTCCLDIDTPAAQQLTCATRLRLPAIRELLKQLVVAQLLATDIEPPDYLGTYTLTLPNPSTAAAVGSGEDR